MSKVFLVGRRRTGIQTIIKALELIGFDKKSILKDFKSDDIESLIDKAKNYDVVAVVRDYTLNEIRAIEAAYPDSRFILTTRDSDAWYASFVRYFNSKKGDHPESVHANKGRYVFKYYEEYNSDVRVHFDGRNWKLLEITMNGSQNWQLFCSYFKQPIPSEKFPHENRS